MTSPHSPCCTDPFGDSAAIRCERAAAELRAGRPVLITNTAGDANAVLALDSSTAESYRAFAHTSHDHRHYLFVTSTRAQALGLTAPQGARFALTNDDYDQLAALAYLRGTAVPGHWTPGNALDAGAAQIARLGLLLPAIVAVTLEDAQDRSIFAGCQTLALEDLDAGYAKAAARGYALVTRTPVPLRGLGMCEFLVFRGGIAQRDQVAIVVGQPNPTMAVPVRVHSSCLTGDLFGSLKCDCGDQLHHALAKLKELGGGVLVYLDQEGRGTGIAAKMRAYGYQHAGLDTIDADAQLGFSPDERRYDGAAAMLQAMGIQRIRLLTNNPAKVKQLRAAGIVVENRIAITGAITAENAHYLHTKAIRAGHVLDVDTLVPAAQHCLSVDRRTPALATAKTTALCKTAAPDPPPAAHSDQCCAGPQ